MVPHEKEIEDFLARSQTPLSDFHCWSKTRVLGRLRLFTPNVGCLGSNPVRELDPTCLPWQLRASAA